MRSLYFAFALVLMTRATQARADLVTYSMTGTITYTGYARNVPFANGDHISWTLHYDRSTPMTTSGAAAAGSWAGYQMSGYVLTNVVDQTTGYHFPTLPPSGVNSGSGVRLANWNPGGYRNYYYGDISIRQSAGFAWNSYYATSLYLLTAPLPTLNLGKFQLDSVPVVWSSNPPLDDPQGATNIQYGYQNGKLQFGFTATVDSISGVRMVPEPGSLTLYLLGVIGLAARGMRRRQAACPRRPLLTH